LDNRPIGVFDSGLGGLTVVRALKKLLPNESIIYFGDTARLPYGVKSNDLVKQYSIQITKFLIQKNAKIIIIACNTATATALNILKSKFSSIPIIGVIEPGVEHAILKTNNKNIGVIGTIATISSGAYKESIKKIDSEIDVISKACPLFVPFVEEGWTYGAAISEITAHYLSIFKNNVDTLILGCTHYPLLKNIISKETKHITLVDSASAVAKNAYKRLKKNSLLNMDDKPGVLQCYVTDLPMRFEKLGNIFLGSEINNIHLVNDL
jgi:glutamate racemase